MLAYVLKAIGATSNISNTLLDLNTNKDQIFTILGRPWHP